jgi:hypothetical protein
MKLRHVAFFALIFSAAASAWAVDIDGRIAAGEYASTQVLSQGVFTLHWRVQGDRIHLAIEAVSKGWIAVGFDPAAVMAKADMVFALVGADGKTTSSDNWSTGTFGPHPADVEQGGTSDILAQAGRRDGDRVVFEFTRLLDTKDKFDKVIVPGKPMKVIWATGPSLASTAKHDRRGQASVAFR